MINSFSALSFPEPIYQLFLLNLLADAENINFAAIQTWNSNLISPFSSCMVLGNLSGSEYICKMAVTSPILKRLEVLKEAVSNP